MIVVETDNALGSPSGDIDDGFALMALLSRESELQEGIQVFSTFGNTSSANAYANSKELFLRFGSKIDLQMGVASQTEDFPVEKLRQRNISLWIALGPLTGVYSALKQGVAVNEVFVVGGHRKPSGFVPPVWPMEFNLVKDFKATHGILETGVRIRVFCLDIIKQLKMSSSELFKQLPRPLYMAYESSIKRWSFRNRLLFRSSFSVWDLAAIEYLFQPEHYSFDTLRLSPSKKLGWSVDFQDGTAEILREINVSGVVSGFFDTLSSNNLL